MIFVTVGTTGFDDLVKHVDEFVSKQSEEFIIQVGPGQYLPKNCKYFRYETNLNKYYRYADVIVSHGGLATISEVLITGQPLVAVEDESQPDRHQREILATWEEAGYLLWCKNIELLMDSIIVAKSMQFTPYTRLPCDIPVVIRNYIDDWMNNK